MSTVVLATSSLAFADAAGTKAFVEKFYPKSLAAALEIKPVEISKALPRQTQRQKKSLRVALDPGHLGGAYAWMEDRLIVQAQDSKIRLSEGDIALDIALNLKQKLESRGVEVFLSRKAAGVSAIGKTFDQWKQDPQAVAQGIEYVATRLSPAGKSADLIQYWKKLYTQVKDLKLDQIRFDQPEYLSYKRLFVQVYLPLDRDARVQQINTFSPDMTFIIHLNVAGPNDPQTGIYKGTTENMHMAFVAGGIAASELQQVTNAEALEHQLNHPDILTKSLKMCERLTKALVASTDVPVITREQIPHIAYLDPEKAVPVSGDQEFHGVFARNLSLNRSLKGLSCYGESFLMDNTEFATRMQDPTYYQDIISKVADAYLASFLEGAKLLK
jgi:hypothetical protein